jgi:PhnB protein
MTPLKSPPDGYPTLSPYLCVAGAADAVAFLQKVFGASERNRISGPDGAIGHVELEIGDSVVMLSDEFPQMGIVGPKSLGGTPVTIGVYVTDVDATFARAIAAGATALGDVEDQFYGDRVGRFVDPFGHRWTAATHIEDVTPEEIQRRAAAFMG